MTDYSYENLRSEEGETEEVIDDASKDTTVPTIQYDITSYGADYDVEGFVNRLKRKDIIIPPFQRSYVWTQKEASRFIESLLIGLPIPGVFFARESGTNKLLVIDGQQRLKTLQFFYDGFFNPQEGEKRNRVFELIGVQHEFEGLTYSSLREKDRIKLNDSLIHAIIIKQDSPKDGDTSMYYIFDRLNSSGKRLTPQEIRTAVSHGTFIDLIKQLNEHNSWRQIFGKKNIRLKDQELILRFLAFYYEGDTYKRPVNEFLNQFSQKHRNPEQEFLDKSRLVFTTTVDLVWQSIGRKAFRPVSAINAAVFDSVMVGLAKRIAINPIIYNKAIALAYNELLNDSRYTELISQSTSDESNVEERIKKAIEKFSGI